MPPPKSQKPISKSQAKLKPTKVLFPPCSRIRENDKKRRSDWITVVLIFSEDSEKRHTGYFEPGKISLLFPLYQRGSFDPRMCFFIKA
jgi:hypothetical protein